MVMEIGVEGVEEKSGGCCDCCCCVIIEFLMQQFDFTTDILFCVELFNRGDEVGVGFKIAQVFFTVVGGVFSCFSCCGMWGKRRASKLKHDIINAKSSEDIEKLLINWEIQQMEEEL